LDNHIAAMNTLGIEKDPKDTRVVVAMSGGVDSSVTAALMVEAGYDVVGITLQLYDHGEAIQRKNACCAGQDIHDARNVASRLNIPHYVLDYESRFRESVMEDFADAYARGETPIPCVRCNQTVKFRDLMGTASDLGADALATGHYVRRENGPDGPEMHRAIDPSRDQSYFLFATTSAQLDLLRFPLGDRPKTETREIAERFNLKVAAKPDSQDICFVPNGSYARIVERLRPEAIQPGKIVDLDGNVLGDHDGIIHFTIGQRRGLDIGGHAEALYVVRLEPETHRVVAGPREALAVPSVRLSDVNWLAEPLNGEAVDCAVKIRSTMDPVPAHLMQREDGRLEAYFAEPQYGVSPGQACVAYEGERVLGGGWIDRE
jgi:tRNA-specific 2-thiouridylase